MTTCCKYIDLLSRKFFGALQAFAVTRVRQIWAKIAADRIWKVDDILKEKPLKSKIWTVSSGQAG